MIRKVEINMFSSPENDKKVRIINLILSVTAIVLVVIFAIVVLRDNSTEQKELNESIEQAKQEEDKQRQEIFQERKELAELEKRKETDSFFEKLNDGFDVKILVIGDEIGAGEGASDKSKSWIDLLTSKIKNNYNVDVYVKNISMSGNSSYAGYVRTMVLSDRVQYDLAIICYGQNDENKEFQMYYESIIRAIRKNYDKCSIISVLESSQIKYTDKMAVIKSLAKHYGIFVADTIAPFTDGSNGKYESLTDDKICPNDKGHQIYAKTIYEIIDEQVDNSTGYDSTDIEPLSAGVLDFDELMAINARDFTTEGFNYVYKLDHPITGIVGIDYKYIPNKDGCKIYIDGKEYKLPEASSKNNAFPLRILLLNDKPIKISDSIEVKFDTQEQSEGFREICISSEKFD